MFAVYVLALIVVFLVVYLFYAVINPERFRSARQKLFGGMPMSTQAWLQIILTLLAIFLISIPLGRHWPRPETALCGLSSSRSCSRK